MGAPCPLVDVVCRIVSVGGTDADEAKQVQVSVLFGAEEVPARVAKRADKTHAAAESFRVFPSQESARDSEIDGAQLSKLCDSINRDVDGAARLLRAGGYDFLDNGRAAVLWIRVEAESLAESTGTAFTPGGAKSRQSLTSGSREKRVSLEQANLLRYGLSPVLPRDVDGVVLPLKDVKNDGENAPPNLERGPAAAARTVMPSWVWAHAIKQWEVLGLLKNGFSAEQLVTRAKR